MLWIRPTGTEIETNDDPRNIAAAKKLGWKKKRKVQPKELDQTVEAPELNLGDVND
jgi:hypothetical protein